MTHKEILTNYLGSKYQEDPQYGYQCVSWVKKYCELLNLPLLGFSGSAINAWKSGSPFGTGWTKINNSLLSVPRVGDVIFFDATPINPYGHVAIVDEKSSLTRLNIVDQNGGTGAGDGLRDNAIVLRSTGYSTTKGRGKCLGWYRYGKTPTPQGEELGLDTPPNLSEDRLTANNDKIGGRINTINQEDSL